MVYFFSNLGECLGCESQFLGFRRLAPASAKESFTREVSDGTPQDRRRTQQVRAHARPLRPQLREAPSGALQDPAAGRLSADRGTRPHRLRGHRGWFRRELDHRAPDGGLLEVPPRLLLQQDPFGNAAAGSASNRLINYAHA